MSQKVEIHSSSLLFNGTELECEGNELRPDGTCAKCERVNERIQNKVSAALTSAQQRGSELQPHKAINFLTALEHQAQRNHEYHPANCAECAMTETIANKLREQLGLTIRAAKQP